MARDLTAALNTQFTSASLHTVFFFKSVWSSGTTYLWTGYSTIVWDSQTWQGVGQLAGISDIEESSEIIANGATFTLSGVPSALLALALGDARQGNEVSLWIGALDTSGTLVVDPYKVFSGLIDVPGIQEGSETSTITLQAENRLIELNRPREVRNSDRFQQARFASDVGFEFVAGLQDKQITWGQPTDTGK